MRIPEIRECILDIKPYVPGKPVEEVKRQLGLEKVIKLASNENPLGPGPRAIEALTAMAGKAHIYPDGSCYRLKQALASHLEISEDQLITGNGSDEIIKLIAEAFLNPGDNVVLSRTTFSEYQYATRLMAGEEKYAPLKQFRYDLDEMARLVDERTKLVFICNPNNPTGTSVDGETLHRFLERIPDRVLVIVDEAYYEYVDDPLFPDSLEFISKGYNVVVLRTFSKIYGLAGLRIGYGVGRPEIVDMLQRVREPFNVNAFAQEAAIAALTDEDHVQKSRRLVQEGKRFLYSQFSQLGLSYVPSQANFVLLDVERDCREVFERLLQRGVIVRSCDIFGLPQHVRVTIGRRAENELFIKELAEVLGGQMS